MSFGTAARVLFEITPCPFAGVIVTGHHKGVTARGGDGPGQRKAYTQANIDPPLTLAVNQGPVVGKEGQGVADAAEGVSRTGPGGLGQHHTRVRGCDGGESRRRGRREGQGLYWSWYRAVKQ